MNEKKKFAILIGINNVPGLDYLTTPANYAREMATWAKTQGYNTSLFVDENESGEKQVVKLSNIFDTIQKLLSEDPVQLLIYFSGHGVEKSAGNDVWLLPEYKTNPNEAINLYANKQLAFEAGPNHIIFISDSCRNPANNDELRHVSGGIIFPKMGRQNYQSQIDLLYSTWPGQTSTDYKDDDGNYKSVYSECLLKCLNGHIAEVIRRLEEINPTFPAVVPDDLNTYLKKEVPKLMANVGINQHPMGEVSSRDPIYLAQFANDVNFNKEIDSRIAEDTTETYNTENTTNSVKKRLEYFINAKVAGNKTKHQREYLKRLEEDFILYGLPDFFPENSTGFFIYGSLSPKVYANVDIYLPSNPQSWQRGSMIWQSGYSNVDRATLIVSEYGKERSYPVPLIPNFVCRVNFGPQGLLSIDYHPTSGNRRREANRHKIEIARRKASIITAAQNGIFQGDEEMAGYIRKYKSLDPILGLFAAYAYFQKGIYSEVTSVFQYMREEPEPVLPDVMFLNQLSTNEPIWPLGLNGSNFPMLTEGWSYLDLLNENPLKGFSRYLNSGLWTSFTKQGLDKIISQFGYLRLL